MVSAAVFQVTYQLIYDVVETFIVRLAGTPIQSTGTTTAYYASPNDLYLR